MVWMKLDSLGQVLLVRTRKFDPRTRALGLPLLVALLALSYQTLCYGTTLQIDVPGTALYSSQAIYVQIK